MRVGGSQSGDERRAADLEIPADGWVDTANCGQALLCLYASLLARCKSDEGRSVIVRCE
jgi:hypothetical protein